MLKAILPVKTTTGIQEYSVEIVSITADYLGRKYANVRALPVDNKLIFPFTKTDYDGSFTAGHTTVLTDCLKNLVPITSTPEA